MDADKRVIEFSEDSQTALVFFKGTPQLYTIQNVVDSEFCFEPDLLCSPITLVADHLVYCASVNLCELLEEI